MASPHRGRVRRRLAVNRRRGWRRTGTVRAVKRAVALVAAVIGLASCSGGAGNTGGADSGAQLACSHFRNVATDYNAGVLTASELRDKLKQVDDDAQISGEPGVATAARQLLAASTAGNENEMARQVTALNAACTAAGV